MAKNKGKAALKNPFELQQKTRTTFEGVKGTIDEIVEDVFKRYKPLSEISSEIAEELIGKNAYKDTDVNKKSYEDIRDEGLTFFMSTDTGLKRTGLLSLFPALLTGIRLYSEMSESEVKTELLSKIKSGIEVVFKFIYRDADWRKNPDLKPVFDASPYESEAFYPGSNDDGLDGRSYIDSISWAVPLFLRIMNLEDKNKEFVFNKEYREKAKILIKWCLDYVNGAVLTINANNENDGNKPFKRPVGWNFSTMKSTKDEETQTIEDVKAQCSLYFTYAAASMYLSLYNEYEEIIDNLQTLNRVYDRMLVSSKNKMVTSLKKEAIYDKYKDSIDNKEYDKVVKSLKDEGESLEGVESLEKAISLKETILLRKDSHFKQVEKEVSTLVLGDKDKEVDLQKALEKLRKYKRDKKRELEDYYFFNEGKSAEYNGKIYSNEEINDKNNKSLGPVSRLKWNLEKISTDIWENAKARLEDNFVYDDFSFNNATAEAIQSGGQTNALFAGLLHISICLYSKYDFVVFYTEGDDSKKFGKKAYDNMQNIMLLHVQRAQRFFDKLSEEDKAFGVDFLILKFSENFSDEDNEKGKLTDRETAERLRKQLIRITSLTPMLLKTNNLISQYVVKYPQKQMRESIVKIGEKRFYDRNKKNEDENKKYCWFWESDGYHAMSNYYYVGAIFDFYTYYNEYEGKYIGELEKSKKKLSEDAEYTKSVQAYYQKKDDEVELLKEKHKKELEAKEYEIQTERDKAKKSEIGSELVSNISNVMKNAIDEPEFLKRIINGIREQLAKEIFERYSKEPRQADLKELKELKKPIEPKDKSLFSLLQALAADIILQSAIEANKNDVGEVKKLGNYFERFTLAEVALNGGEQLIKDGLINRLFEITCVPMKWKTKQED